MLNSTSYYDTHDSHEVVKGFASLKFTHSLSSVFVEELRREKEMQAKGHQRYLEKLEKTKLLSVQNSGTTLINDEQNKVIEYIINELNSQTTEKGRGRPFSYIEYLGDIDPQILALIALTTMLDSASFGYTRTKTLISLGRFVDMESWGMWLRSRDPRLEKMIKKEVEKDHSSWLYREKAMRGYARRYGHERKPWDTSTRTKVGSFLYNAVLATCDLFEEWKDPYSDRKGIQREVVKVGLTFNAKERIQSIIDTASWNSPVFAPMIVPPVPWQDFDDMANIDPHKRRAGCYYEMSLAGQVPLVRGATSQQVKNVKSAIYDGSLQPMLDALNMIQATPLEINLPVLQAVEWAWDEAKVFGKFPRTEHLPRVQFPDDYDTLPIKTQKRWRKIQSKVIKKNRQIDGDRLVMNTYDLPLARELATLETKAFYLPHSWDFRGRVYPVCAFSHHRGDHIKALFLLHKKKPVGEQGIMWIALKVADTGDFDKISKKPIDERLRWVEDHQEQICEIASDFKASFNGDDPSKLYWSQADKPFQFLAACIELSNCIAFGETYESGLPIGLDGSNSGVQHFAAMTLNMEEAELVNLVPQDQPNDIYGRVAELIRERIDNEEEPDEISEAWRNYRVDRKTVKRNVMTFPYSSNLFGFKSQLRSDFMEPINERILAGEGWNGYTENPFAHPNDPEREGDGALAAGYLAKHSWAVVNQVIISAAEGMGFLKKLSDIVSNEGKLMKWVTPMGFPISQRYTKSVTERVKVFLHDREHDKRIRKDVRIAVMDEREVNKRKSASSIAPNFVHGLDSAHLHATVLKCADQYGIKDFFMIHDSFGTNPADTSAMYEAVRLCFVEQYLNCCVFTDLLNQVKDQLDRPEDAAFPEVPTKGDLDLVKVLESKYCFL